jgi:hypothetical protein
MIETIVIFTTFITAFTLGYKLANYKNKVAITNREKAIREAINDVRKEHRKKDAKTIFDNTIDW